MAGMSGGSWKTEGGGRTRRIVVLAVGVVVMVVGLFQIAGGIRTLTAASTDPAIKAASQKATAAATTFLDKTKEVYRVGNTAALDDPTVKAAMTTVFDTSVLRSKTATKADLDPITDWLLVIAKVGTVYLSAGSGVADLSKMPNDQAVIDRINGNVVTYAPQIGAYLDAAVTTSGSIAQAVPRSSVDSSFNATMKEGLEKMRGGTTQTIGGALGTIATAGLTEPWRRDRVNALQFVEPALVKFLEPAQCNQLRDLAAQVSDAIPDAPVKAQLGTFRTNMSC